VRAKVRTWLPDRSLICVRPYWGQIWRIWDLTHLDEHCGKEGSSTRQNTCEYHSGGPFGIVSDQPSILLAKSQGPSQYVVHFRDDMCRQFVELANLFYSLSIVLFGLFQQSAVFWTVLDQLVLKCASFVLLPCRHLGPCMPESSRTMKLQVYLRIGETTG